MSSTKKTLGQHVELSDGTTILIRPWGFDELAANSGILTKIVSDVLDVLGDEAPEGDEGENVIADVMQRNFGRLRSLIVASAENGEKDLEHINGLLDLVNVIEAVVDTNGIVAAMGKIQARLTPQQAPKTQSPAKATKKTSN